MGDIADLITDALCQGEDVVPPVSRDEAVQIGMKAIKHLADESVLEQLTIRDRFALEATKEDVDAVTIGIGYVTPADRAVARYVVADAMMAARGSVEEPAVRPIDTAGLEIVTDALFASPLICLTDRSRDDCTEIALGDEGSERWFRVTVRRIERAG